MIEPLAILEGDALERLKELDPGSVQCCVTSPPYWGLRDYGNNGQLGLEKTPEEYVAKMVEVFREVRRVLRKDGTLWLNLGDSYTSGNRATWRIGASKNKGQDVLNDMPRPRQPPRLKEKDLIGIPWRVACALQADGWWLRSGIVWAKPNGMPGSQDDRPTSSYEFIFLLTQSEHYWSDFDAIKTPPRESSRIRLAQDIQAQAGSHRANGGHKTNGAMKAVQRSSDKRRGHSRRHDGFNDRWDLMEKSEQQSQPAMIRDVWFVAPAQFADAHFAVMPREIARRCILAGCPIEGTVLDPFAGSGTTGMVALELCRKAVLIELNPKYVKLIEQRCDVTMGLALA